MSNHANRTGGWNLAAVMRDVTTAWRLFWNPSVPTALKVLLPVAAMVYWLSPLDLMPGLPFDDIALMILALKMFVSMAPVDARQAAEGSWDGTQSAHSNPSGRRDDHDVVDTTWKVVND